MLILKTKLKNAILKKIKEENQVYMDLVFSLDNIKINGVKKGCSGFVRNLKNNSVVYISTEEPVLTNLHYMYRYANTESDYCGYRNRWADNLDMLSTGVVNLLKHHVSETIDFKFRI